MLNTTQQIGAALGPALLNTLYMSALAGYLASNRPSPAGAWAFRLDGFLHGYRTAFVAGGCLFVLALLVLVLLIKAKKDGVPSGRNAVE